MTEVYFHGKYGMEHVRCMITKIRPDAYKHLSFQKFKEEIPLVPGAMTVPEIYSKLRESRVSNFADSFFQANPKRVFEVRPASAVAVIAAVAAPVKCLIDDRFFERALSEGLGPLDEGAGPLVACNPALPHGSITVATRLMGEDDRVTAEREFLWKIIKNTSVTSLNALRGIDILDGTRLLFFAKL